MKLFISRYFRVLLILVAVLLCMTASAAVAANATSVIVNSVTLDAGSPYWKNGGGGSAADWNVFFDTSTAVPTLRMKNAVIDTVGPYDALVLADGDLELEIVGTNTLTSPGSPSWEHCGILVGGQLLIRDGTANGSAVLNINLSNNQYSSMVDGIFVYTANDLIIDGGTINIDLDGGSQHSYGLWAYSSILIRGGKITVNSTAQFVDAVYTGYFQLASGSIVANATSTGSILPDGEGEGEGEGPPLSNAKALICNQFLATCGYGEFNAIGDDAAIGGLWVGPDTSSFRVLDGRVIFTGDLEALIFDTFDTVVPYVDGKIFVSENIDGSGKIEWDSSMGILAGNIISDSPFLYVEMVGRGQCLPKTGDESSPWLWLAVGMAALLGAAVAIRWQWGKSPKLR